MRYFIKTNLKVKLGSCNLIPGTCDFQIGGFLADKETVQFPGLYGHRVSEPFRLDQTSAGSVGGLSVPWLDEYNEIRRPTCVERPQLIDEDETG